MADPAKATVMPWGERRRRAVASCREAPCYPVDTILARGDVTVAYPKCNVCVHEAKFRKLKGHG